MINQEKTHNHTTNRICRNRNHQKKHHSGIVTCPAVLQRNIIINVLIVLFCVLVPGSVTADCFLSPDSSSGPDMVIPATVAHENLLHPPIVEVVTDSVLSVTENSSLSVLYTITATTTRGGTICPQGVTRVLKGGTLLYSITPDFDYFTSGVLVDDNAVGVVTEYTFRNIAANHTISAVFSPERMYILTPIPSGGGSITPANSQMVLFGDSVTFTIQAEDCYTISDISIDYSYHLGPQESPYQYTFKDVDESHTIAPAFTGKTCIIAATAGMGGSIAPSGDIGVSCGWSQRFFITPDPGYHIDDVFIDNDSIGPVSSYLFENVTTDHTINAHFASDSPDYDVLLHLVPGWNCISIPKKPAIGMDTLGLLFGRIESDGHSIYMYDASCQTWDIPSDTHPVTPLEAYWIYTTKSTDIFITYATSQTVPWILLKPSWNLIGYFGSEPIETRLYLASLGDAWELILGYDATMQRYEDPIIRGGTGQFSDERSMQPKKGYWISCEREIQFISPF